MPAIQDPDLPIVDPHHHLWPGSPTDLMSYSVRDLRADTRSGHHIVATIFVECISSYYTEGPKHLRPVGETDWVASQSVSDGLASGIVGYANLTSEPAELAEALDAHIEAGDGRFKGVRHTVAWDANPGVFASRSKPPPGLLLDTAFRRGAAELARRGLVYETWTYFHQLPDLCDFARSHPNLVVVLNHLGGPAATGPYSQRRNEVLEEWRVGIMELARVPNVVMKLGGIGMPAFTPVEFIESTPMTSARIADYWGPHIRHVIDTLGPGRCMFESNFPVDRRLCDYVTLWNSFKLIAASYSSAERESLFAGTARRTYGLG
ncbi:amidohydrolase family protein [Nonomuraea endophytica]|uniref:Putative TIM-barrel fold metal-dependent hydrolase n=1 Tax=Nonomuraea endophytica TaxID=714136 RepID=A0A7W8A3T4_9ACTN|nr:amidohydrolase family protein [Nonomuraea endophytica]MBB5079004.1 putative TIM-barrel fold metal-dependent hydrolase [Nonomuraea endophytica]